MATLRLCTLPVALPPTITRRFLRTSKSPYLVSCASSTPKSTSSRLSFGKCVVEYGSKSLRFLFSGALCLGLLLSDPAYSDAKTGVNKPELLPKERTTVIDVAGFLSSGQVNRLIQLIAQLEEDTGFKLRILAQNYPDTPGLAIKDFWEVDDRTIIFVADPTFGNIIHFNVGDSVDIEVPRNFWSRVAGKYGNMFYWKEKGEDASVEAAVTTIANCLRNPTGQNSCSEVTLVD